MFVRKLSLALLVGAVFLALAVVPAFAHVHGITPLNCPNVPNNPNAGALGTNGTPADDDNGGPISGLIPRDTGNSPLTGGDGGFRAACD